LKANTEFIDQTDVCMYTI